MRSILNRIRYFAAVALAAAALFSAPAEAGAQETLANSGYSPYSLYGFGDIARQGTAYNFSMGGIGIGDRNIRYINVLNPAAVTARDPKSFMMDFGLENRNIIFQGNAATALGSSAAGKMTSAANTFNMHNVVASFPIASHSAFKLGIMPYSSVAYSFRAYEKDENLLSDLGDIQYLKTGQGGVYQAFFGAGVTLWDCLSLGADLNYYFGNIMRKSEAYFTTNSSYRTISSGWDYNISSFGGKFGLQFSQRLGRTTFATIGATYSLNSELKGGETRYAYGVTSVTDTVVNNNFKMSGYRIPSEIGVGISVRGADSWMVGFDYTTQDWTGMTFEGNPGVDLQCGRSQNFRAGFEFTPNRYDIRYFLKRWTYRAGLYHEQSHMVLNGSPVAATGFTLGFGIPASRYYHHSINFGVDIGQRGSLNSDLIRERYFIFTISFNLHDIWFIKPMYN